MRTVISVFWLFLLGLLWSSSAMSEIRKPAVAGGFYPIEKDKLQWTVKEYLKNVKDIPKIDGQIIALIVPHAGYVYSGQVAAYSYKLLEQSSVHTVILCGPSHRYGFRGLSVYGPGVIWETPLGKVVCNDNLCSQLLNYDKRIVKLPDAHRAEHSLEVQLPFLQVVLDSFQIVPIVMGYQDSETISLLSKALSTLPFDTSTVFIASTDWQHYRPAEEGWKMDSLGMNCVQQLDPDRLERMIESGRVEMCGGGPAIAVIRAAMAKGANRVKILRYGDSGDITGDKSSVVGYVAAVLYKSSTGSDKKILPKAGENTTEQNWQLTEEEKKTLLTIARQSITSYLTKKVIPEFTVTGKLAEPGAAFVTLEENNQLRGCIGHTMAVDPLYKTVSICAIQAAVADPRFPPVQPSEIDKLHIEISWLTPLQEVKSLDEIKVGRDGLMITLGNKRGLLLPQVATEYGWDRTQFLENTCRKAGLPPDAYKLPDVKIEKFQAIVFGEE